MISDPIPYARFDPLRWYASLSAYQLIQLTLATIALFAALLGDLWTLALVWPCIIAVAWIDHRVSTQILEAVLYFTCIATCMIALGEYLLGIPWLAWTGNVNLVGYIAALGSLVCIKRRNWISLGIAVITLIIVRSTGAWLSALLPIAWHYRGKWVVICITVGLVVLFLIANESNSYSYRLNIWSYVSRYNLIGSVDYLSSLPYYARHMHNALLQMAASFGILPALVVVFLAASVLYELFVMRGYAASSALFVLISGTVDFIYWWPGIAVVVAAFIVWSIRAAHE